MTTTIYPGVAAATGAITGMFSYYGTDWYVIRGSGAGVSAARTITNEGVIADFGIVPNTVDKARRSLPQVDVFGADWFGWSGNTALDIQADDILWSVDHPTIAFYVPGPARPHLGPLIAPCEWTIVDTAWPLPVMVSFALLLEDGLTALLLEDGLTALILE